MIDFKVRKFGDFKEVQVFVDRTVVDLGLLREKECREFAQSLRSAAEEIWPEEE